MAATHPGDGSRAHRPYLESRRTPFVSRPSSQGLESVSRLRGTAPLLETDERGAGLSPCPSRARGRQRPTPPNGLRHAALYLFRPAQVGPSLREPGYPGLGRSPPPRSTHESHVRVGTAPQSPRRSRPPGARRPPFPMELSRAGDRLSP